MTEKSELQKALEARQKRMQEAPMTAAEIEAEENRIRALYLPQVLGGPEALGWHTVPNRLFAQENKRLRG
jgi:hypothetical protein